jgi:hypothetical protein
MSSEIRYRSPWARFVGFAPGQQPLMVLGLLSGTSDQMIDHFGNGFFKGFIIAISLLQMPVSGLRVSRNDFAES